MHIYAGKRKQIIACVYHNICFDLLYIYYILYLYLSLQISANYYYL